MSGYPLEAAWALRQRQEQAALGCLEEARRAREAAEARAAHRRETRDTARATLDAARAQPPPGSGVAPVVSAREAADRDRFISRLREAHRRASAAYDEFEAGPLHQARDAEEQARRAHGEARRAREALDHHQQNFREEERRARERRDEDEAEEAARASRHHKSR